MNCANHPDVPAVAYCRTCGKPLCSACVRDVHGVVYCEECLASRLNATMPPPGASPCPRWWNRRVRLAPAWPPSWDYSRCGRHVQRRIRQGLRSCADLRHPDLDEDHVNGCSDCYRSVLVYMPIEAYKTARQITGTAGSRPVWL